ncbi:transcription termination factor NusA [Patescibacteria group bacterium]|nr:transcription termination factor NusA [Patescibacteria group bacterium]MBU1931077.1 transcription termination factor NusA [Patescibacteria group bacterium]
MTTSLIARTEFAAALNQVCAERGISLEAVLKTIEAALVAAYRKDFGLEEEVEYLAEIDPQSGKTKLFSHPTGKPKKKKEITPPDFGRIAAQTAKQVILQKIREAEKDAILDEFSGKIDTIVNGMILRFDNKFVICDIGRGQGVMPPEEQVRSEHYQLNQRLVLYIKDIRETYKGKQVVISRADPQLVVKLFSREVPEVNSGAVEIKLITREPGNRTKIAVLSTQPGVDPVGSCVGQKGVRVQAVIHELNGEKIDIVQYHDDPEKLITAALSPAEKIKVKINKTTKTAKITAPEDQVSLAIGKDGQNIRLAAKLSGYKLEIIDPKGKKVKVSKVSKVSKEEKLKKEKPKKVKK